MSVIGSDRHHPQCLRLITGNIFSPCLVTLHGMNLIKYLIFSCHWSVLCSAMTYVLFWQTAREKHHSVLQMVNLGQFFQQLGMRIISLQSVRRSSKVLPLLLLGGEPFTSRLSWECYERKKALREERM